MCGEAASDRVYELEDTVWKRPGRFALVQCRGCTQGYLSPRPVPDHIGFYYEDFYADGATGKDFEERYQFGSLAARINRGRLRDLLARKRIGPGDKHLDVGCGLGAFVLHVAKTTGAAVTGVDVDPKAIESVTRRGREAALPVEGREGHLAAQTTLEEASFASASMIHFLEHVYEPVEELRRVHALLAKDGAILVEVPNFHALGRKIFGRWWMPHCAPQHLTLSSRATLKAALEKAGFVDVEVKDSVAPLVLTASLILWWKWNLGTASRFARNWAVRAFTIAFALTAFPVLVLLDVLLTPVMPRLGVGEAIRATAFKR